MWRKLLITGICLAQAFILALAEDRVEANAPVMDGRPVPRMTALVIGNSSYPEHPLPASANDAHGMDRLLRQLGFDVILLSDASGAQMAEGIREFEDRLKHGGTGLFYFAGHGYRQAGHTLLTPVNTNDSARPGPVNRDIDLQRVLDGMSAPRSDKVNVVVLDTCLDDMYTGGSVAVSPYSLPSDTVIAYATAPGSAAMEGMRHGIFTAELLGQLSRPQRDIRMLFADIGRKVAQVSGRRQTPWVASTLTHTYALPALENVSDRIAMSAASAGPMLRARGVLPKDSAEQYELSFWDSVKDSNHASDYEAYLEAYPKGRFAALAKARIQRLKAGAAKEEATGGSGPPAKAAAPAAEPPRPAAKANQNVPPPAKSASGESKPQSKPQSDVPAPPTHMATGGTHGEFRDCPTCPTMVGLTKGSFTMGSNTSDPSEKPAHVVTIGNGFAIGKYEVTVEEWNACVSAGDCPHITTDTNRPKAPIRDVSWDDAQIYVKWLTKVSGKPYRLPTEAEWEYAARAGTSTRFWWGDKMRQGTANCKDCGQPWQADMPAPVGSFAANPYGLYDMNGSVWEWVSDCWHSSYKGAPSTGKTWDDPNCRVRVIRGGSWREGADYMPSTTRFKYDSNVRQSQNGFRVARDNE